MQSSKIQKTPEGEIGRIITAPKAGERFALAGRTWEVSDIDPRQRIVWVQLVQGRADGQWSGSGGDIHTRILQRMRQLLAEETIYPYLQSNAQQRLQDARKLASLHHLGTQQIIPLTQQIIPLGGGRFCVLPWLGSAAFKALLVALILRKLAEKLIDISDEQVSDTHKFDEYLPRSLVKKSFVEDYLNVDEMKKALSRDFHTDTDGRR